MTTFGLNNEEQVATPRDISTPQQLDVEALLRRAIEIIDTAKSMPLSASVIIPREDIRPLLEACMQHLPHEVREANWMLRERAEFLEKMQREGDEIVEAARERAERMVQRSDLVREAQRTAQRIMDEAQEESRRLRHEAEDYCDQKLASFEIVLEKTWRTVQGGREKLRGTVVQPAVDLRGSSHPDVDAIDAVFDQEAK
jgi:F0F1-type ATP synthase membrane subunit b/b'